jgi:hypothetical protein
LDDLDADERIILKYGVEWWVLLKTAMRLRAKKNEEFFD